ncbi:hypothetical protein D770_08720 [Flammeovirgaceae bacterium 311]|nr:hypothetical protein D770_08720 [Flammeovirgaceae bacterium 311]
MDQEQLHAQQEQPYVSIAYPADGGPIYAETNLENTIVEPWNAVSSLAILLPAVYWAIRIRNNYRKYPFLTICLPFLFLGGLGSTIYHAFRSHRIWLLLDITPSAILTLLLSLFFWMKVLPRKWMAIPLLLVVFLLRMNVWRIFPSQNSINISYALSGIAFFVPILLFLARTRWQGIWSISLSIAFLLLSLLFRQIDQDAASVLPMGTHFLWHFFSGVGAYFLGLYLYQSRNRQIISTA